MEKTLLTPSCLSLLLAIAMSLVFANTVSARCLTSIATTDNVRTKMDEARDAACSIYFEPGLHSTTDKLSYTFTGTLADPVLIYGDSSSTTKLYRPNSNQNMLDLSGDYFIVKGLELEGGARGIRLQDSVNHATFSDLEIHATAESGFTANTSGMSYTNIAIRQSRIYDTGGTGECFYMGCNNGACTMGDSVIEFNNCSNTNSSQGSAQGEGIDLKGGAFNVVIRHNIITNTIGAGILTYANGGGPQNIIEGNLIWAPGEVGIQFTGDVIIQNNVVIMDDKPNTVGINGSPNNQGTPNNTQIRNNTVNMEFSEASNSCLEVRGWGELAQNMVIANNAFYCKAGTAIYLGAGTSEDVVITNNAVAGNIENVSSGTFDGGESVDQFINTTDANFYPLSDSILLNAGANDQSPLNDFNCSKRAANSTDVGAYYFEADDNPGWLSGDTFKACVPFLFADGFE